MLKLDICLSPALYPFYRKENEVVIVVDVFRASTTMCAMCGNGASAIIPVIDIEEAKKYKANGFLVGAERNAQRCDFADFGNSPFEYQHEVVAEKEIVFTTTNGTEAIHAARDAREVLIGAFSNIDAVVNRCMALGGRIVVLCAGWNNKVNLEDMLFGGAFYEKLNRIVKVRIESDTVRAAYLLWRQARENLVDFLKQSDHYKRLGAQGLATQADYCLQMNTVEEVLFFDKTDGKIKK